MHDDLFVAHVPPPGGLTRVRKSLANRVRVSARRRKRRRYGALLASAAILLGTLVRSQPPAVESPRPPTTRSPFDPQTHPALAVATGAPLPPVSLRDGDGTLRRVATNRSDILLYEVTRR